MTASVAILAQAKASLCRPHPSNVHSVGHWRAMSTNIARMPSPASSLADPDEVASSTLLSTLLRRGQAQVAHRQWEAPPPLSRPPTHTSFVEAQVPRKNLLYRERALAH
uniref:Uncharacterized protein n=1 Tax=Prorocentrum micans TaxID=2945 RepID=A0A7S2TCG5_PROMC